MDFNDLNKSQLILLALLVAFIASIATSIATVSLLQVAPTNVTNTINRVIEKTIEQTTPATSSNNKGVQTTVIVKEDDLIVDAIARYKDAQVKISVGKNLDALVVDVITVGFVGGPDKLIVADGRTIEAGKKYIGSFGTNSRLALELLSNEQGIAVFRFAPASPMPTIPASLTIADINTIKIGQTLIFYSESISKVLKRIASSLTRATTSGTGKKTDQGSITLNDDISGDFIASPALTLDGEVAGIAVLSPDGTIKLVDADAVKNILRQALQ